MSRQNAILLAVAAASVLAVLTAPRPAPPPDPGRDVPELIPDHVRSVGMALATEDLVAGRVTLPEAAARFRELERLAGLPGADPPNLVQVRPGPWSENRAETGADRLYLRVLAHVEAGVEFAPPGVADEVFGRLGREYLALRSGGRPLEVPDLLPDRRDAVLAQARAAAERAAAGLASARRPAP